MLKHVRDLHRISHLALHPGLNFAFSHEFVKRKDGWENLAKTYALKQQPLGIEHGLAYQAVDEGKVDLIDIYSTDGEISRYDLKSLDDDLNFFPCNFRMIERDFRQIVYLATYN